MLEITYEISDLLIIMSCLHLACNEKLQCIISIRMCLGQEGVACMAFWITDLGRHSQYRAGFLYIYVRTVQYPVLLILSRDEEKGCELRSLL